MTTTKMARKSFFYSCTARIHTALSIRLCATIILYPRYYRLTSEPVRIYQYSNVSCCCCCCCWAFVLFGSAGHSGYCVYVMCVRERLYWRCCVRHEVAILKSVSLLSNTAARMRLCSGCLSTSTCIPCEATSARIVRRAGCASPYSPV